MKFYKNEATGEFTAVREGEAFDAAGMTEVIPNTTDAAKEKHVPVITREGQTVTVAVGDVAHPMLENHYIQWILLETKNGEQRAELSPGEEPCAQFFVEEQDEVLAAYELCNLHGLWKGTL